VPPVRRCEGSLSASGCSRCSLCSKNWWTLQDSSLRLQPCETLFTRQRETTRYHLTSSNDGAGRRKKTARDVICGAFCGAKQFQSGCTWSSHSISSRAIFKRRRCLQQIDELAHGNPGLSKDCRECPSSEFPVIRDNDRSAILITKFHVATSLTDLFETDLPKRRDGLLAGNNR